MRWTLAGLVTGVALCLAACGGPTQVSGVSPMTPANQTGGSQGAAPRAQPFTAPSAYLDKSWTSTPDANAGGSGAYLKVPSGWGETKRGTYWSDFLDPTEQVRLRVDVTAGLTGDGSNQSTQTAASNELDRLREAAGFKQVSRQALAHAAEIVYQFSRAGQTVQATFWFLGDTTFTQATLGIYYPPDQQQVAEGVLEKVAGTVRFAG